MPDQFAQSTGPIQINFNGFWQALIGQLDVIGAAIWTGVSQNLPMIGATIFGALTDALYTALLQMFLAILKVTLVDIPHALTDQFPPVAALFAAGTQIAAAGLVLSIVLLGLRTYYRGIVGGGGILDEALGRIVKSIAILSLLPWGIGHAIDIEQAAVQSITATAFASITATIPTQVNQGNPLSFAFSLLLMFVLGIRLCLKLLSNVVHVAVAIAWAPVAIIAGFIPEGAWVTSLWTREFVGRLMGVVLATAAVAIGWGIAVLTPGILAFLGAGAAFIAAADLVDWLARTPGASLGGVLGAGVRSGAVVFGGVGGAAISAGSQAAAMRSYSAMQAANATHRFNNYD